ncbi:lipoprotein-releasing ABC transporter ATP-binding protein LolD [Gallaecimonas pentaromativorans]|uniref:Lipoprotein-releasing system ATP-binding protein LolD n=1 Tax=Gallaecimonas pentaromativorans TaxID=584787 RepID=A0A3N1PJW1_9GAMM|nr:lipoprotein-releasing ABC transporter ATP-binding protein LolD [Gallaecimonas pentaromativorans]MED5523895.1 lipoprotein-releasing ABC transporter ATP-binding protein LolD [Pseudomonadota bacterium]ROQ24826.1 lipoprotein-releasing system ATP-binding protein [Gallaecimonas pentaromativorans]
MLRCKQLTKIYHDEGMDTAVLTGVNLGVEAGETLAIVGSSGSGKSTLLHLMGTLDQPSSGQLLFDGEDMQGWNEETRCRFRNQHLGFVYQFHHLLPEFSALENAAMPALIQGDSPAKATERAKMLLDRVGLSHRLNHRPSALSGGERQRVAIARALVNSPRLVLADEPTGNLDETSGEQVYQLIQELNQEFGIAFVVVTHDRSLAAKMGRVLALKKGVLEHP